MVAFIGRAFPPKRERQFVNKVYQYWNILSVSTVHSLIETSISLPDKSLAGEPDPKAQSLDYTSYGNIVTDHVFSLT